MTQPTEPVDNPPNLGELTPDDSSPNLGEETPAEPSSNVDEGETPEPETFPREYVEQLRQESGRYRQRAQRADDLAQRLHLALVTATGKLADPTDLPFDETHLDDAETLTAAIDDLLNRKPHLATRRPSGDVGQGASSTGDTVSLAGILRANAT